MRKTNRYLLDRIRVCCDFRALHLQLIRISKHAYPGYGILNSAVKKKMARQSWHHRHKVTCFTMGAVGKSGGKQNLGSILDISSGTHFVYVCDCHGSRLLAE